MKIHSIQWDSPATGQHVADGWFDFFMVFVLIWMRKEQSQHRTKKETYKRNTMELNLDGLGPKKVIYKEGEEPPTPPPLDWSKAVYLEPYKDGYIIPDCFFERLYENDAPRPVVMIAGQSMMASGLPWGSYRERLPRKLKKALKKKNLL